MLFRYLILFTIFWEGLTVQGQPGGAFHHFIQYNTSNGLSSYNVKKIIQDSRGFTWIATQDGLNLFDGHSFRVFRNTGQYWGRIADNAVMDLAYHTAVPYIWLCLPYKGIQTININNYTVNTILDGEKLNNLFLNDLLTTISLTPDAKQLWIGSAGSFSVIQSQDKEILYSSKMASINPGYIKKIIHDQDNHTYVITRNGRILIFETASIKLLQIILPTVWKKSPTLQVNDAISVRNGEILIATDLGLTCFKLIKKQWTIHSSDLVKQSEKSRLSQINSLFKDNKERVWIASATGLLKFEPTGFIPILPIIEDDHPWLGSISTLLIDKEENLWLGCKHGLALSTVRPSPFQHHLIKNNNSGEPGHIYNIYPETKHSLLASSTAGLYRVHLRNKRLQLIGTPGLSGAVFRGPDNHLIVSAKNRLYVLDKGQNDRLLPAESIFPELSLIKNDLISEHLPIGDSLLLLGSDQENGLYLWNYRRKRMQHFSSNQHQPAIGDNTVNFIRLLPDSTTALIGGDKSLTLLDLRNFSTTIKRLYSPSTDSVNYYFDFHAKNGSYYFACYQYGIIETDEQFNIERTFTEADGLTNNGVYRMEVDPYGEIWVSSNNGLSRINPASGTIKGFYKSNGLHGNNFEEFSSIKHENSIFMGGLEGITQITPWQEKFSQQAIPLYFHSYSLIRQNKSTDSLIENGAELIIPPEVSQTTIHFSAIEYNQPQQLKFEYRLDSGDSSWIQIGKQHYIALMGGLSPGNHVLSIRATADNKNWSDSEHIVLKILPKWHQTWQFKAGLTILIMLICYALYTYRINSLKLQQKIRKDIAHDLHDDLGSTLTSMQILTHLSKEDPTHLEQLELTLTDATTGLRDMIWVLDESGDQLGELITRIKKSSLPTLSAINIELNISIQPGLDQVLLTKLEKKNILLILKEAINNSIKYSDCTLIELRFQQFSGHLQIEISDNGKGFDYHTLGSNGNGLHNIFERAKQIKLHAQIRSTPGSGTTILLSPVG